jgi:NAD(P)-dependent dehydrogenase (short-subunit alcohol dehydrogenase family)/acyl carrier protein
VTGASEPLGRALCDALGALGHAARIADGAGDETTIDAATDLIVDARLAAIGAATTADDALRAALELTTRLQAMPRRVPRAVLGDGRVEAAPVREAVWGLLAALEAEDAERRLVRITLGDGWSPAALAGALSDALAGEIPETRIAVGGDGVRVLRLAPVTAAPPAGRWSGSVLVTGGLGALGLSVAQQVAEQGATAIALMSRSAPDAAAQAAIDALRASGVQVAVARGDVTDPAACARAVAEARALAPLAGVFHLAGINDDHAFDHLTPAMFDRVFAAKARGAAAMADAVRGEPISAFVLFSSVSGALGSAGQVNYATANGYLDGLARALRATGIPATSVSWGPWVPAQKAGMAATAAVVRASERAGIRPLTDADAAPVLALAAAGTHAHLVAVAADFTRYAAHIGAHPRAALVSGLLTEPRREASEPRAAVLPRGWLRDELAGAEADAREDRLRDAIRTLVAEALGDARSVDDALGFSEMGLDSIMVIDLRTHLAHALGVDLPATVAIDYPNVPAMARFITGLAFGAPAPIPTPIPTRPATVIAPPSATLSLEDLVRAVQDDLAAAE